MEPSKPYNLKFAILVLLNSIGLVCVALSIVGIYFFLITKAYLVLLYITPLLIFLSLPVYMAKKWKVGKVYLNVIFSLLGFLFFLFLYFIGPLNGYNR